jgi:hypothetical protein
MTGLLRRVARTSAAAGCLALVTTLVPAGTTAPAWASASPQSQLAQLRNATAAYHNLDAAEHAGFVPFLQCFDDATAGGMGQHFLLGSALNGSVDLLNPPVLVYEPRDDGTYRLVAVEYVVPGPSTMTPPQLLGQPFTYNSDLGVWKLHAWVWRPNPAGMFADFNPNVRMCP